jgi:HlyD family secretion protein
MKRWIVLGVILIAMGAVLGNLWWTLRRGAEVTLAPVTTGRVVSAVYATGRVDTDRRATVRARVTAPLAALEVGPGQPVREGEILGRQDERELALAVERLESDVDEVRARLREAKDGLARAERLEREQLIPANELVSAHEAVKESEATLASRQSAVRLARERAGWVVLRAPLAGTVTTILRRAGDPLREGDEVLTIVDLAEPYLRVAVDERDLGRVASGQEVRIVFDAFPGQVMTARVGRVVPAVDRLTKSADVLVPLPAARPAMKLDLTATVNIVTGVVENALTVPRAALEGSGAERTAFVIGPDGRAAARGLQIGACDEERCEVRGGLTAGEPVIAPLPPGLKPGDRVRAAGP